MKKALLVLCLLAAIASMGLAQSRPVTTVTRKYMLNETTVVKDSAGKQYSYGEWTKMMASKKYDLVMRGRPDTINKNPEFLIRLKSMLDPDLVRVLSASTQNTQPRALDAATSPRRQIVNVPKVPAKPAESEQFHAGDVFKTFNERDINGEKFDLKKMTGKVFVINFWFINCPPCRAEIPDLNAIVDRYKDNKDVVFIAICLDEKDRIQNFLKFSPYNYHIIEDGKYVAAKYNVNLYPTNVVVNKQGKVAYSSVSNQPANPYWITKTIDDALQVPYVPVTK